MSAGTVFVSNCHRIASHRLFTLHRAPCVNVCQARTFCRLALYSDLLSCGGKSLAQHRLMPSCHTVHTVQQKSLLSLSAVVNATSAADVVWEYGSTVYFLYMFGLYVKYGIFTYLVFGLQNIVMSMYVWKHDFKNQMCELHRVFCACCLWLNSPLAALCVY